MSPIYNFPLTEMLTIFTITLFIVYIIQYQWKRRVLYRFASKIQGPLGLPFVGVLYKFIGSMNDVIYKLDDIVKNYQEPLKLWIGNDLYVLFTEPESYKIIYNHPKCINKAQLYKFLEIAFGHGLMTAPANKWKGHRKSLFPTFNQRLLNSYVPIIYENAINMEEALQKHLHKTFDVSHVIEKYVFATVCRTSMSLNIDNETNHFEFIDLLKTILHNIYKRMINPFYYIDSIFYNVPLGRETTKSVRKFHEITESIIKEKRLKMKMKENNDNFVDENGTKFKSFLELLLELVENGEKFTVDEIRDEVSTLLFGGIDTTTTALSFTLIMLGMHPEIQEQAYEEAIQILGRDGSIEYQDLANLNYIECCIYEVLRLFPIGPIVARKVDDNIEIGDTVLPKGSCAVLFMYHTHRSEKYWPNPLKFDPNRFLPEEVAKRHPYSYTPFTAGPRKCIGSKYGIMALKTYVAHIVRKFKISTPYKTVEEIKIRPDIVIKAINGHNIQLEVRQ